MAIRTYAPRILKPVCKIAHHGVSAYLVESHTPNCFHFVWLTPDNRYRCDCTASKYGRSECSHKQALRAKLEAAPHGLREAAFVEQQAEAERLASLPRELSGVETSEETKLSEIEQPIHKCHDCSQPETAYRCHSCQITFECEKQYRDEMRAEAERLEAIAQQRAAKREAAVLQQNAPEEFSIYASVR